MNIEKIKCDNESYSGKQSHREDFYHHSKCAVAVTQRESWVEEGMGWFQHLSDRKLFQFHCQFPGQLLVHLMDFLWHRLSSCETLLGAQLQQYGCSSSSFWHQFPPPISGTCHQLGPPWSSFNTVVSEASWTLSAPLGLRCLDWTIT